MDGVSDRRECVGRQKVRMGRTSDSDCVDVLDGTEAEKHREQVPHFSKDRKRTKHVIPAEAVLLNG